MSDRSPDKSNIPDGPGERISQERTPESTSGKTLSDLEESEETPEPASTAEQSNIPSPDGPVDKPRAEPDDPGPI